MTAFLLGSIRKAKDDILPTTRQIPTQNDDFARDSPDALPSDPERYICACFPGMTYKKYLHHVDVNKARTDPQLFLALRQRYFDWKPIWKRVFTLRTLSRVEYFEVSPTPHATSIPTNNAQVQDLLP